MILLALDTVYWLTFILYITGGIITNEHHHFAAIQEILRVTACLSLIALFSGIDLTATQFVQGWIDLGNSIKEKRIPKTIQGGLVTVGASLLIILFFLAPLIRHWNFGSWTWDLGTLMNIIWRGGHGYGFTFTVLGPPGAPARDFILHSHLSLWLYPMSWLYRFLPSAETLIFLQSLAMISCVVPLYLLAQKYFPKNISPLLLPIFFWCFETLHRVNMWDVHENAFITVFALWALYFFSDKKYWRCGIFTICVALFKEDAYVLAGTMGCFFLFSKGQKTLAIISLFLGFFIFVYYSATQVQTLSVGSRYAFLGTTYADAKTTMLTRPWVLLLQLGWPDNILFYLRMALVAGGLWLLGGWSLFMVAPVFFEIALSTYDPMRNPSNHYIYPMAGPLFFSAALGMKKLGAKLSGTRLRETVTVLLLICLMQLKYSESATIQSVIHSSSWQNRQCLKKLVELLPNEVAVYGRDPFFTHLANRPVIWEELDYAAYPQKGWTIRPVGENVPASYEVVKKDCGFQVLKARGL